VGNFLDHSGGIGKIQSLSLSPGKRERLSSSPPSALRGGEAEIILYSAGAEEKENRVLQIE